MVFYHGTFEADGFGLLTAFDLAACDIDLAHKDFDGHNVTVAGDCSIVNEVKIKHIAGLIAIKIVFL